MSNDTDNMGNNNIEMDILSDVSISGKLKVAANQIQFESDGILITGDCSSPSSCVGSFNLSTAQIVAKCSNDEFPVFNKSIETQFLLSKRIVGNYFVNFNNIFYPIVDSKVMDVPKSCTAFYILNWGNYSDQFIIPNITSWMHNPKGTTEFCKIELDMSFSHDCSTLIAYKKDTSSDSGSSDYDTFLFVYSMISYCPYKC